MKKEGKRSRLIRERRKRKKQLTVILIAAIVAIVAIVAVIFRKVTKKPEELTGTTQEETVEETKEPGIGATKEAGTAEKNGKQEETEKSVTDAASGDASTGKTVETEELKESVTGATSGDASTGKTVETEVPKESVTGATSEDASTGKTEEIKEPEKDQQTAAEISKTVKDMSLRDKISFLVMPSLETFVRSETETEGVTMVGAATRACFERYPAVLGFILAGNNVENSDQFENLITDAKAVRDGLPMAFAVSEDAIRRTGLIDKLETGAGTDMYMGPLLKMGTFDEASESGTLMGKFLNKYGINIYILPELNGLADQEFTEDSDVIGGYIEGLRSSNIHVCAAFYPEKGTQKDQEGYFTSVKTRYNLENKDSEIMKHAVNKGIDMIMVPDCRYPQILPNGEVASMSKTIMTDMIRGSLGFSGIIITDVMSSEQLGGRSSGQAAAEALIAGADIVLAPDNYEDAVTSIQNAVQNGELAEDRINESVQRILNILGE